MNNRKLRNKRSSYLAVTLTAFTAASLFATSNANAQEWLKDRQYQEGAGIRTGDLEIHPGLGAEIGYDSNYLLRSHKDGPNISNAAPAAPVEGAGILRITPSLTLATLGQQRKEGDLQLTPPSVAFRAGIAGTYREFFGAPIIRDQRNISGTATARLDIMPQRPVGFGVYGSYERTVRPSAAGNPDLSFNRNDVGVGGELVLQPGGGTLDWRFGYQFRASLFEQTTGVPYTNITHEAYTRGRWRFRPRTAFLYDASLRWLNYTKSERATTFLNDGAPTRARIGLTGLVTPRLGFLGMVGYGATFFNNGPSIAVQQYDSVIGQAELKFYLSATPGQDPEQTVGLSISSISVGYNRDFMTSFLGNYYGLDRGYAKFVYMFGGRFLVSVEGGLGALSYPEVFARSGAGTPVQISNSFTDLRGDASLFGEYRITNGFAVNTTFRYSENFSDKQLPLGTGVGGANLYDLSWRRFEAFLGLRLFL